MWAYPLLLVLTDARAHPKVFCEKMREFQSKRVEFKPVRIPISRRGPPRVTGSTNLKQAIFGGGCFWCTEAVFQRLRGVEAVVSGYAGGAVPNPSYEQVCSGSTGHAEVVQITFDPTVIAYAELLEVFFQTHDPTAMNRQGNDVGTQYRSVVFYLDDEQRRTAEAFKEKLNHASVFPDPVVTEISPLTEFYPAESYHQDYFRQNGGQPYCQFNIRPKLEKLERAFSEKLK